MSYPKGCGWSIGKARATEIGHSLFSMGFQAIVNPMYQKIRRMGIDVYVEGKNGNLKAVMESTNFGYFYMSKQKAERTVILLNQHPYVPHILVVSFPVNYLSFKSYFRKEGIIVLELGFQTVPKWLYNGYPHLFVKHPNLIMEGRKTQYRTTKKLRRLFNKLGIYP